MENFRAMVSVTMQILSNAKASAEGSGDGNAKACLLDANRAWDQGRYQDCRRWALRSLSYSEGVFSERYRKAQRLDDTCG